jgi:hypothetical protein
MYGAGTRGLYFNTFTDVINVSRCKLVCNFTASYLNPGLLLASKAGAYPNVFFMVGYGPYSEILD